MRRVVSFILLFSMMIVGTIVPISAEGSEMNLRYNNAATVNSSFVVQSGDAVVNVNYSGYQGVITEVRISVKLEKRTLLLFWKDVTEWQTVSTDYWGYYEYRYAVSNGTYRATIHVEVDGINGATDIIDSEFKSES